MNLSRVALSQTLIALLASVAATTSFTGCSATDRETAAGTNSSSALTLQTTVVRETAAYTVPGPFVVRDGTLYRIHDKSIYAGDVDDPDSDHVLAAVPQLVMIPDHMAMIVTTSHVVVSDSSGAWRVPRGGGALEPLPKTEYPHALLVYNRFPIRSDGGDGLVIVGYHPAFYGHSTGHPLQPDRGSLFRVDYLAAGASTWSPLVSSTEQPPAPGGTPIRNAVHTDQFVFENGKVVGVDENWGPYIADPVTSAFRHLDVDFWRNEQVGFTHAMTLRGNTLYVLRGDRVGQPSWCNTVKSQLVAFDIAGVLPRKVLDVPPGGTDFVITGNEVYLQSSCTSDVQRVDLNTGTVATYSRPVTRSPDTAPPVFGDHDVESRTAAQRSRGMVADGGYLYFAHDNAIRRVTAH